MAEDPRLIVPVGTCEQHGPHLPMGTASIIAEALADDLSATYGVLRAPTIEYGVNVAGAADFPGNGAMRRKTLHRMLNDLLAAWERSGFREFILLTAQDHEQQQEALATVITTDARVRVVDIHAIPVLDLLDAQQEHLHGGEVDTSLMLYLAPSLVHMELAVDQPADPNQRRTTLSLAENQVGLVGLPTTASAAKGERLYERMRQRICDRIFLAPALDA